MDQQAQKKLRIPVALAVVVLASAASACTTTPAPQDAAMPTDTAVADAGDFDAGCVPPEVYDPSTRTCIPVV
jgi:hypothetical protein